MPFSSEEMRSQFDAQFGNLASDSTNSGAALDQLAVTTTAQYSKIKGLITLFKAASVNGAHSAADVTAATPLTTQEQSKKRI